MLAGFLAVLKIIGIVLLCILAFVLFIVLLVLFVPIRYRADVLLPRTDLDEGFDINKISASAAFSWLWFVIRGGIEFPKNKVFTLKVFGIKILPRKAKASSEETDSKTEDKEDGSKDSDDKENADGKKEDSAKKDEKEDTVLENASEKEEEGTSGKEAETGKTGESTDGNADETSGKEESNSESAEASGDADEDKSFLDVLWNIIDTVDKILETPITVFEKIQYTISRVCGKIDMIKSTIENDIFQRAFDLVKKKLLKVIRMILPDKIDMDLLLGTGDPALTAELMGAYGALYPVLFKKVRFTPDFENRVVFLEAHIKGHITVFTIVYSAAVCYFNKDVKKTIRRFKKIAES